VTSVDENIVTLEIAPGINIKIGKGFIASLNKQD
jgi:preprotein translocase subunit YajC